MLALRYEMGQLAVAEVPMPEEREALVRVLFSGICNTDLEIVRGYAGFEGTIGHEFVGVVERVEGAPHLAGRRVVGEINAGCGVCSLCLAGDPRHCPERTVLGIKGRDGAHAEYLSLPARNIIPLPEQIKNEHAVFIEPLAAAFGITELVDIRPETRVAVIGDGKLGLLCAFTLATRSKNTSIIGKHSSKLQFASQRGIETVLLEEAGKMPREFDVVIEASGAESGFATALNLVRPKGKIVLKSTFQGRPAWEAWRIVVDEISVVGSRCGRFGPAIDLLSSGEVEVGDLISDIFPLCEGVRAVERAAEPGAMKVLLKMAG